MDAARRSITSLLAGIPGLSALPQLPGPGTLLRLAGRAAGAVEQAVDLVPRLATVVGQAEALFARVVDLVARIEHTDRNADDLVRRTAAVIDDAERAVRRTDAVIEDAEGAVRRTGEVVDAAGPLVDRTGTVLGRTDQLVDRLVPMLAAVEPLLDRVLPLVKRIAETTSPQEIDALVRMVDHLPGLVEHLDTDIVPILDTFGSVAPDVRDLLDIVRELNEMLASVPGMGKVKRRIEAQQAAEDEAAERARYRADEVPPAAPARKELTADSAS